MRAPRCRYRRGSAKAALRRLYDFAPTKGRPDFKGIGSELADGVFAKARAKGDIAWIGNKYGGAGGFLHFLVDVVRPTLASRYRMSDDNTLFGDFGGGTFCTFAIFAHPRAFKRYICGSPALFWDNFAAFRIEEQYARTHKDLPADVFFGLGENEILGDGPAGIFSSTARMAEILNARRYPSLKLHIHVLPGEEHSPVVPTTLSWALRSGWQPRANSEEKK